MRLAAGAAVALAAATGCSSSNAGVQPAGAAAPSGPHTCPPGFPVRVIDIGGAVNGAEEGTSNPTADQYVTPDAPNYAPTDGDVIACFDSAHDAACGGYDPWVDDPVTDNLPSATDNSMMMGGVHTLVTGCRRSRA